MKIDFDKFKTATGYDIEKFFTDFTSFVSNQYQYIITYYNGGGIDKNAFAELERLIRESKKIEPLFELNKSRLNTLDMWELLDVFSDIQIKLDTLNKMGKWQRSSKFGTQDQDVKISRILNQNENFENVAKTLGYSDVQNSWFDIALKNEIIEEEYTKEGGTLFKITLKNDFNIDLPNIVDYFTVNNVYGKDVYSKITYENNDLKLITGKDNLEQNFQIKLSTLKNTIPEFPEDGIDGNLVGSNVALFQYPTIIRQILALFKKDARWREVNIIDIFREEDAVFIKIEAKSILEDSYITNINL